jgi:excinuclease ABC subunit C
MTNRKIEYWVIPPKADAEFVASMEEVLERRFRRWQVAQEKSREPGGKLDPAFGRLPDLLLVDGGKGQLSRALQVLRGCGLAGHIQLASLAKGDEVLYLPGRGRPLILPRRSEALHLVQRIRDEAHRFALRHHHARRRQSLSSRLDEVPGIGPAKRKALLQAFGTLEKIREADVEDLSAIPGIGQGLAQRLKADL